MASFLPTDVPYAWAKKELVLTDPIKRGSRSKLWVRRVQEWLSLNGHGVVIDEDFGPATEQGVRDFQQAQRLDVTGIVDGDTFAALSAPMLQALTPIKPAGKSFETLVVAYAKQHLKQHPREIGGQNRGPWVRLYMHGHDGRDWAWCAGFVCFILQQAADAKDVPVPIARTFSCDVLAERALQEGRFVTEQDLKVGRASTEDLGRISVFLNRRTPVDWTHTGFALEHQGEVFSTIEGNTNDEGSREGYEVCARHRGYRRKDFIRIA